MEALEYFDELEAFSSFLGENVQSVWTAAQKSVTITIKSYPRTASNSRICFVSAVSNIYIPFGYPNEQRPCFSVSETSGMADDGLGLTIAVQEHIDSLPLGECFLFTISELITDYLDNKNDGECMICADSLQISPNFLRFAPTGLTDIATKTFCGHCFHLECLAKWAAISLGVRRNNKAAKSQKEHDDLLLRAQDGQLRCYRQELSAAESRAVVLSNELATLEISIEQLKVEIESSTSKTSGRAQIRSSATTGQEELQNNLKLANSRVQKITADIAFTNDKIAKLKHRVTIETENGNVLARTLQASRSQRDERQLFPCPYCRHELSAVSLDIDVGSHGTSAMEASLAGVEPGSREGDRAWQTTLARALEEAESSMSESSASNISVATDFGHDISKLPSHILEYVRSVQAFQQQVRSKLRSAELASTAPKSDAITSDDVSIANANANEITSPKATSTASQDDKSSTSVSVDGSSSQHKQHRRSKSSKKTK